MASENVPVNLTEMYLIPLCFCSVIIINFKAVVKLCYGGTPCFGPGCPLPGHGGFAPGWFSSQSGSPDNRYMFWGHLSTFGFGFCLIRRCFFGLTTRFNWSDIDWALGSFSVKITRIYMGFWCRFNNYTAVSAVVIIWTSVLLLVLLF